jgi:hypothetical protein
VMACVLNSSFALTYSKSYFDFRNLIIVKTPKKNPKTWKLKKRVENISNSSGIIIVAVRHPITIRTTTFNRSRINRFIFTNSFLILRFIIAVQTRRTTNKNALTVSEFCNNSLP